MNKDIISNIKKMLEEDFPVSYIARQNGVEIKDVKRIVQFNNMGFSRKRLYVSQKKVKLLKELEEINKVNGYDLNINQIKIQGD